MAILQQQLCRKSSNCLLFSCLRKDNDTYIEYILDNGVIEDVEIIKREKTVEEKVQELKSNPDVQKVSKLIELSDKAGVLIKMAEGKYASISDAIKDSVINEPINTIEDPLGRIVNNNAKDKINSAVKESVEIMKMGDRIDEIAVEKREEIADKIFKDEDKDE